MDESFRVAIKNDDVAVMAGPQSSGQAGKARGNDSYCGAGGRAGVPGLRARERRGVAPRDDLRGAGGRAGVPGLRARARCAPKRLALRQRRDRWSAWPTRINMAPSGTYGAARAGSLPCLRYAIENGAQLHPNTAWAASPAGAKDCLEYMRQIGKC